MSGRVLNYDLYRRTARKAWMCDGDGAGGGHRQWAPDCKRTIQPSERCAEYTGATPAFQSGPRICAACCFAFWKITI